jgi:hypothetical protein
MLISQVRFAADEVLGMPCNSLRFAPRNDTLLKRFDDAFGNDLIDVHDGLLSLSRPKEGPWILFGSPP